jgi:hypothetical protein
MFSDTAIQTPLHPQAHAHDMQYWTAKHGLTQVTIMYFCECGKLMDAWTE